jgi:methionyl-tRNA formyltransferase
LLNSDFEITKILSNKRSDKLPSEILKWKGDYILSFRSLYILPPELINSVSKYAINFHPGPPMYPGSGSVNLALYNNEIIFGVTAHIINKEIDSGEIIDILEFPIEKSENVNSLLTKTHENLYLLFKNTVEGIVDVGDIFIKNKIDINEANWSGVANKIKFIDNLQKIDPGVTEEELERVIKSIHTKSFPIFIEIYGNRFELKD